MPKTFASKFYKAAHKKKARRSPFFSKTTQARDTFFKPANVQAKFEEGHSKATSIISEKDLAQNKHQGAPLAKDIQAEMESGFGANFNDVRLHTGRKAIQMNQELGAAAFTYGSDIYFNQGKYQPESKSGKHLLAHELTHVVQQSNNQASPGIQKQEAENQSNARTMTRESYIQHLVNTYIGSPVSQPYRGVNRLDAIAKYAAFWIAMSIGRRMMNIRSRLGTNQWLDWTFNNFIVHNQGNSDGLFWLIRYNLDLRTDPLGEPFSSPGFQVSIIETSPDRFILFIGTARAGSDSYQVIDTKLMDLVPTGDASFPYHVIPAAPAAVVDGVGTG